MSDEQLMVNAASLQVALTVLNKIIRMSDSPPHDLRIPPGLLEDRADIDALRDLAAVAGINPGEVTSRFNGSDYAHPFTNEEYEDQPGECRYCLFPERWHDPEGRRPPHDPKKDPHLPELRRDNPNICEACGMVAAWHDPEGRKPPVDPRWVPKEKR